MIADGLQALINRYLALDLESKTRLQKLAGKVITLKILGLNLTIQMHFMDEKVNVILRDFVQADTVIQGAPLSLMHLTLLRENRKTAFAQYAVIQGDLDVGQDAVALFDEMNIDWEEYLSKWLGDVPAHHAGRMVKDFKRMVERVRRTLTQQTNEYIHEEINLFPTPEALQDFFQDVDNLRHDVDRLEARIARLLSKQKT